jgi:hypothetical protein
VYPRSGYHVQLSQLPTGLDRKYDIAIDFILT